jgi:hypothetical protein
MVGRGSDVRPADADVFEEARRRSREVARRRRMFEAQLMAEIAEGEPLGEPRWYALTIQPAHEGIAFAHLAARRFGVYLPTINEMVRERGAFRLRHRLILPGYVFIASLGLSGRWRRPLHCPGVTGYVYRSGADRTRDEPAPIPQRFIDEVRAEEAWQNAQLDAIHGRAFDPPPAKARSRSGNRRARERQKKRDKDRRRRERARLP